MIINEKNQQNKKANCKRIQLERISTYEYLGTITIEDGKIDAKIINKGNNPNKTIIGNKETELEIKTKIYVIKTLE